MNLLEKFEAVTIEAANRVSPSDQSFCEKHQEAYEAAVQAFQELSFFWRDVKSAQKKLLGGLSESKGYCRRYLVSRDNISLSADKISKHIEYLHHEFISTLVDYFNNTYSVTVSCGAVEESLLPGAPDRYDEKAQRAYHAQMQALIVRYEDVVDQIILRLDGRTFEEQAFHELAQKCHDAAWNTYQKKANYERRKNVIRFTGYGCRFQTWVGHGEWELQDCMKSILTGAAHFETGSYHTLPMGFSELLGWSGVKDSTHAFPTCEKVLQLRMFKSGRVDLKFSSDVCAEEFVNRYLGTVC